MRRIPFLVEKIYVEGFDNINTPENFIRKLFDHNFPKTKYVETNEIQCFENCNRSFSDIFSLVVTKFPEVTMEKVSKILINILDQDDTIGALLCPGVKKVVFFTRKRHSTMYHEGAYTEHGDPEDSDMYKTNKVGLDNISFDDILTMSNEYNGEEINVPNAQQPAIQPQPVPIRRNEPVIAPEVIPLKKIAVYGSLKRGYGNHALLRNSRLIRSQVINIPFTMIDLGAFPGLIRNNNDNQYFVEIYEVTPEVYRTIETLEGYPNFYTKHSFDLEDEEIEIYVLNEQNYNYNNYPKVNRQSW